MKMVERMMVRRMVDLVADLDYSVPSMLHFQEGKLQRPAIVISTPLLASQCIIVMISKIMNIVIMISTVATMMHHDSEISRSLLLLC